MDLTFNGMVNHIAIDAGDLGFDSRALSDLGLPTRHLCGVSSGLYVLSGAKPWRWSPPLVTRCGVIARVL